MEVGDYSAKSGCYGAFERRRETSTMEVFKADIKAIAPAMAEIKAMMTGMMMMGEEEADDLRKVVEVYLDF